MDALSSSRRCRRWSVASAAATVAAAALVLFTPKGAAALEAPRVMTGHPLDRVVAGANRLFALSGSEVRTFDGDGEPPGRCAGFPPPPRTERPAPLRGLAADEA